MSLPPLKLPHWLLNIMGSIAGQQRGSLPSGQSGEGGGVNLGEVMWSHSSNLQGNFKQFTQN